jgi:hypothetical protein
MDKADPWIISRKFISDIRVEDKNRQYRQI